MNRYVIAAVTATRFAVVASLGTTRAHAISCKGAYQVTSNGLIETPYCEDNYLAHVARGYGIHVTNLSIRQNPSKKREICYAVGRDTRVSGICAGLIDSGGRR